MIRAIITGATGMVGEGVLHECLEHPEVEAVLVIGRKSCGVQHPKLTELLHSDFSDFTSLKNQLKGYNAAYLCMGTTSFLVKEETYRHITYDLTMALAKPLSEVNPDMTVCYVSGAGTDSTKNGKLMWTRIKGKLENDLLALPFKQAFMYRPGYIQATPGLKNAYTFYKMLRPIDTLLLKLFPGMAGSLKELGLSMINVSLNGFEKQVLDVVDIRRTSKG